MKYRKDKRTKNLTLRDIHVGDWVQVWSEISERYSAPLKIIQICDDGTIYLITSEEERPIPWEEDIKNVDALEITPELLKGFGFDVVPKDYPEDQFNVLYNGQKITELWKSHGCYLLAFSWRSYHYFHHFLDMYYKLGNIAEPEWKGLNDGL